MTGAAETKSARANGAGERASRCKALVRAATESDMSAVRDICRTMC